MCLRFVEGKPAEAKTEIKLSFTVRVSCAEKTEVKMRFAFSNPKEDHATRLTIRTDGSK
jgi:hypothetical protein